MSSGTNELLMIADFNNIKDNVTKTYFLCLCSMRENYQTSVIQPIAPQVSRNGAFCFYQNRYQVAPLCIDDRKFPFEFKINFESTLVNTSTKKSN